MICDPEVADPNVNLDLYEENGEFILSNTTIEVKSLTIEGSDIEVVMVSLTLKRRSTFYILNTILPVVFLSILNTLVFLLPEESGEKVSLSVSLLLSYAIFLTLINSYLPENSDTVCFFSVYLVTLVIISTLTSVTTIFIMALHNDLQKDSYRFRLFPFTKTRVSDTDDTEDENVPKNDKKFSIVSKCNKYAFIVFFLLTVVSNIAFFASAMY